MKDVRTPSVFCALSLGHSAIRVRHWVRFVKTYPTAVHVRTCKYSTYYTIAWFPSYGLNIPEIEKGMFSIVLNSLIKYAIFVEK
jgi:hypothetical protein